ncbi:MAG TPA: hypothetical protein VJU53_02355 [Burkholderiaceae bacterium]|nr:hypothetical protein [Burkholderiaceae bacterium]
MSRDRINGGAGDSSENGANRELTDRYRMASGALDERPAAAVRASIMAAAAREVGAKPVDAAASYRARPRWPLAAAAAVMLSTLAVMMAIRTNEEMPQFSSPPAPARTTADKTAPPAVTPPAVSTVESTSKPDKPQFGAPSGPAPSSANNAVAPAAPPVPSIAEQSSSKRQMKDGQAVERPLAQAKDSLGGLKKESNSVAQAPREENRTAMREAPAPSASNESERARQNAPAAAPAQPSPPEAVLSPKLRAEQGAAAGAAAPTAPMDQASSDTRRDVAKSAASSQLGSAQSERKQVDESASVWLERIIKLRREGRHDEADAELKRFRERYPQVQPPSEALPPAGTR